MPGRNGNPLIATILPFTLFVAACTSSPSSDASSPVTPSAASHTASVVPANEKTFPPLPNTNMSRSLVTHVVLAGLDGKVVGKMPKRAREVAVSPDGRTVAFSHGAYTGIWTMGLDRTNLRRVTRSTESPSWSPDGGRIMSFAAARVFTVDSDGSDLGHFPACGASWGSLIAHPKWSPDGKTILCTMLVWGGGDLSKRNVEVVSYTLKLQPTLGPDRLNQKATILAGGDGINAWDGDWAPDGSQIAFSRGDTDEAFNLFTADPAYDIWVMNADGSDQHPLVSDDEGADVGPFWSPNGTMVGFTRTYNTREVWIADVTTGRVRDVGPGTLLGWLNNATLLIGTRTHAI